VVILQFISQSLVCGQVTSPFITVTPNPMTFGPAVTDTVAFMVTSNVKWKIVNSVGWIKTDPEAWFLNDGNKRVKLTPNLQWLTKEDITGTNLTGSFTLEEDSSLPTKVIKTVNVTLKAYPGILTIPVKTITFQKIESQNFTIVSNLSWTLEKQINANWLNITPSFSLSGTVNVKLDCIMSNAGSKDNSVYLIIKQAKGVVKDSILVIQAAKATGISDYEHSGIKIYPQPARETLNVELPANNAIKNWTIYNTIGVELLKGRIENNHTLQIPMIRLVSGVYFITLESDTQKIGLKFTK
jgi:hypothetical protein